MYARIVENKLEIFEGSILNYTVEKDEIKYYAYCVNPTEDTFNEAGYYKVSDDVDLADEEAEYEVIDNVIVTRKSNDAETSVQ